MPHPTRLVITEDVEKIGEEPGPRGVTLRALPYSTLVGHRFTEVVVDDFERDEEKFQEWFNAEVRSRVVTVRASY